VKETQSESSSIHGSRLSTLSLIAVDPAVSLAIHWLPLPVLTQGGCKLGANFLENNQAAVPDEYFDMHGNGVNDFLT